MYAVLLTRPDLCTTVTLLSRYKRSKLLHKLLLNVLKYVKETIADICLNYYKEYEDNILEGYVESDWGGCSEFIALSKATNEACWLSEIISCFDIHVKHFVLFEDNQSTIKLAYMASNNSSVKKIITLEYISTNDYIGNIFTKALCSIQKIRDKLFNLRGGHTIV